MSKTEELVNAIRYYERKAEAEDRPSYERYWTGVSYGIQHAVRILEGTAAGDALVQRVIDAQRAEEAAAESMVQS
jgi:hypothetical protein